MAIGCNLIYNLITMRKILSTAALIAANTLFLGVFNAGPAWGVPADPKGVQLFQPGAAPVTIFLKGDEFYSWNEDDKGYTVLKDGVTREWVYAEPNADGTLRAGPYKAGSYDPAKLGIKQHMRDAVKTGQAWDMRAARSPRAESGAPLRVAITSGTLKNLVILVKFSDQTTTYSQAEFASLFNDAGYVTDGAAGSVKSYYLETSYNKLTVVSTVSPWVALSTPAAYYGANAPVADVNPRQMVLDAIYQLDADGFDFSAADGNGDGLVDGLDIIHSGRGEEKAGNNPNYIWSHQWSLAAPVTVGGVTMQAYHTEPEVRGYDTDVSSKITRIGVICHETGHFLGLPDLYDTTYASYGIGNFCVMAFGSWNGDDGTSPAHMSAWCKKTLGWSTPTQLALSGTYSLDRVEDHSDAIYLIRGPAFAATEYFLMENKQGFGFDAGLPGPTRGILIWHVDETKANNTDKTHYLVALMQADGHKDLESKTNYGTDADYFRLGNNTVFNDTTTPSSLSYSAQPMGMTVRDIPASGDSMRFYLVGAAPSAPSTVVYPQPWKPRSGGTHDAAGITFANLPDNATVRIYTVAGELVYEFAVVPADLNFKIWDGKNSAGKNVASGVYFANVKVSSSVMKVVKIAIER